MYIKKLYIKDFGIYDNCTVEKISPKIVVLGGKNRAGKSTLLELLRSLPYGFNKTMDIKANTGQYEAYGQFIDKKDGAFNLSLKGYSKPHIFNSSGNEEFFNLYKDVDKYTYSQIFTISLDELAQENGEDKKLRAVLLGAGLKELLVLPEMISYFKKEAEKIAGKNGNPASKLLKPYYNEIKEGNSIKKSAVSQIENYEGKEEKLKEINAQIEALENDIKTNENSVYVLQFIKSNYDNYKRMEELENNIDDSNSKVIYNEMSGEKVSLEFLENLKSEYENVDQKYEVLKNEFYNKYNISEEEACNFKKYAGEVAKWRLLVSGINEKIDSYKRELRECQDLKDVIARDIT
ncbi:MAG: AAA family ATPase, partial [Clostridium sp.]|nr:AAA family ATPase [Clostridium sp.]